MLAIVRRGVDSFTSVKTTIQLRPTTDKDYAESVGCCLNLFIMHGDCPLLSLSNPLFQQSLDNRISFALGL